MAKPFPTWTPYPQLPGFIYLMRCGKGIWKIGRSSRPERRARELGFHVVHMIAVQNMARAELLVHRLFAHRVTDDRSLSREYFHLKPADVRRFRRLNITRMADLPNRDGLAAGHLNKIGAPKWKVVREYLDTATGMKCEVLECGHTLVEGIDFLGVGCGIRRRCRQCATADLQESP